MTLIHYLTRVHFADGVLEEALRSELESNGKKRPLVIADPADLQTPFAERVLSGLPARTKSRIFDTIPNLPTQARAREIAEIYRTDGRDSLVCFGRSRTINLAKAARLAIALPKPEEGNGRSKRLGGRLERELPLLCAIPGLGAIGAALSDEIPEDEDEFGASLFSRRERLPSVVICDPTITLGADPGPSASAGVDAMARCIEAYLSNAYNPPADGIAMDGLRRGASHLHKVIAKDNLDARREMMAASLNGALALQKGAGTSRAMGDALIRVSGRDLDAGALGRLLLPQVLRFHADAAKEKYQPLRRTLGIGSRQALAGWLWLSFSAICHFPKD